MREFTSEDLKKLAAAVEPLGYVLTTARANMDFLARDGEIYSIHITLEPKKPAEGN